MPDQKKSAWPIATTGLSGFLGQASSSSISEGIEEAITAYLKGLLNDTGTQGLQREPPPSKSSSIDDVQKTLDEISPGFPASLGLLNGDYWDRTDSIVEAGAVPYCCGKLMSPRDDHGRFWCSECGNTVAL
ncbi:MAG: hypothetical protein WC711_03700 [Candidatus Staskawiczbacteria bacterium]|jgi:hypothetical protein